MPDKREIRRQEIEADRRYRVAITRAIDNCGDCDQYGRLDDLSDCPRHDNHRNRLSAAEST